MSWICRLLGHRWGSLETVAAMLRRETFVQMTGDALEALLNGPRRKCRRCPAVEW